MMSYKEHLYSLDEGAKWDSFKDSMRSLSRSARAFPHVVGLRVGDKLYKSGYGGEKVRNFTNKRGRDATEHLLKAMDYHDSSMTKIGRPIEDKQKIMYYNLMRRNQEYNRALGNV